MDNNQKRFISPTLNQAEHLPDWAEMLKTDYLTSQTKIPPITPAIKIRGSVFAARGEVSFVAGQAKAGKSRLNIFFMATAFISSIPHQDMEKFLHIRTEPHNGGAVILIDTEQHASQVDDMRQKVYRAIGHNPLEDLPNLHVVRLKKYKPEERLKRVLLIAENTPDIHLLIIDGIADLISNANDIEQSNDLIDDLALLAEEKNFAIIAYMHENQGQLGAGKLRGHLGSQAERKAAGVITVKLDKDSGIRTISPTLMRYAGNFDKVYFEVDDQRDPVFVEESAAEAILEGQAARKKQTEEQKAENAEKRRLEKENAKAEKYGRLASEAFQDGGINYSTAINRIGNLYHRVINGKEGAVTATHAKNTLKELLDMGLVNNNAEKGLYALAAC